jgi:hypothetical protein
MSSRPARGAAGPGEVGEGALLAALSALLVPAVTSPDVSGAGGNPHLALRRLMVGPGEPRSWLAVRLLTECGWYGLAGEGAAAPAGGMGDGPDSVRRRSEFAMAEAARAVDAVLRRVLTAYRSTGSPAVRSRWGEVLESLDMVGLPMAATLDAEHLPEARAAEPVRWSHYWSPGERPAWAGRADLVSGERLLFLGLFALMQTSAVAVLARRCLLKLPLGLAPAAGTRFVRLQPAPRAGQVPRGRYPWEAASVKSVVITLPLGWAGGSLQGRLDECGVMFSLSSDAASEGLTDSDTGVEQPHVLTEPSAEAAAAGLARGAPRADLMQTLCGAQVVGTRPRFVRVADRLQWARGRPVHVHALARYTRLLSAFEAGRPELIEEAASPAPAPAAAAEPTFPAGRRRGG